MPKVDENRQIGLFLDFCEKFQLPITFDARANFRCRYVTAYIN